MTISVLDTIQFILSRNRLTQIDKIQEDEVGQAAVYGVAQICLGSNAPRPRHCVGVGCMVLIGNENPQDVDIQKMIDNIHPSRGRRTSGPVNAAVGKGRIRHVIRGLEEVRKLVEDVWNGRSIGAIIWKPGQTSLSGHACLATAYQEKTPAACHFRSVLVGSAIHPWPKCLETNSARMHSLKYRSC